MILGIACFMFYKEKSDLVTELSKLRQEANTMKVAIRKSDEENNELKKQIHDASKATGEN